MYKLLGIHKMQTNPFHPMDDTNNEKSRHGLIPVEYM